MVQSHPSCRRNAAVAVFLISGVAPYCPFTAPITPAHDPSRPVDLVASVEDPDVTRVPVYSRMIECRAASRPAREQTQTAHAHTSGTRTPTGRRPPAGPAPRPGARRPAPAGNPRQNIYLFIYNFVLKFSVFSYILYIIYIIYLYIYFIYILLYYIFYL